MELNKITLEGTWLKVFHYIHNNMNILSSGSLDNTCLSFGMEPMGIWISYDGRRTNLGINHFLQLQIVILTINYHDYMTDEWGVMGTSFLSPKDINQKTLINYGA